MRHFLQDVRQFLRSLARTPGYAVVSIVVLGLGMGVGLAALAIAQRALFAPLPYGAADRLAVLFEADERGAIRLASYPTVQDWTTSADAFDGIAYVTGSQELLRQPGGPELVPTAYADIGFFHTLRAGPLLGRTFGRAAEHPGSVVVLSEELWREQFAARPDIVGRTIPLGDAGATVIGIMPRAFRFPEWAQAWMPLSAAPPSIRRMLPQRNNHADSRVIARLRDGVTTQQAGSQIDGIAAQLAARFPDDSKQWTRVSLVPMQEYVTSFTNAGGGVSLVPRIGLIAGAAALLLLLGCANVAVLTLVRGLTRARELAVRSAIGASRARIVRLLVAESFTLAAVGAAVGIGLGYGIVRLVQRANPELFPRLAEVQLDATFVLGGALLTLIVGIGAGLAPALRATPRSLNEVLGNARSQPGTSRATGRLQRVLIGGQVGVAMMLLVGATLLVVSLKRVIDTPVGFTTDRLSAIAVNPPTEKYDSRERTLILYQQLMAAARAVPGVDSVAFANHAPLGRASYPTRVDVEGRVTDPENRVLANFKTVTPNYFATAGIPLLLGRTYSDADLPSPNGQLVINQQLARRLWPNEQAIGKRLTVYHSARWLPTFGQPIVGTVIGVTGDVRHFGQETDIPEEVYVPYTWDLWQWGSLVVHTTGDPRAVHERMRRALLAVEPDLPIGGENSMESFAERLTGIRGPRRLLTVGLAALAAAALGITMLGLYATLAYAVARRRSELGVRFALGATRAQVLRQVMREGLTIVLIGAAVGLLAAWLSAQVMSALLYDITPRNAAAFALAVVPVLIAAIAAVWIPARRAAALNPTEALRAD
jgi:putative ABC transport system permease protein